MQDFKCSLRLTKAAETCRRVERKALTTELGQALVGVRPLRSAGILPKQPTVNVEEKENGPG